MSKQPSKILPRRHPSSREPIEEESTYHSPVRCRKFMVWVKKKRCCHCQEPGPNDPAHVGGLREGKGRGIKVDDLRCVSLCRKCHDFYDEKGYLWIWSGAFVEGQRRRHTEHEMLRMNVEYLIDWFRETRVVSAA